MEGATAHEMPSLAAGTREEPQTGCTSCYRRSRRFPWRGLTSLALVALVGASSTSTALGFNDGRGSRVLRGAGDDGGLKSALEVEAHRGLAPAPLAAALTPQTKAAPAAPAAPLQPVTIHTLGHLYLSKTPAPLAISPDNKHLYTVTGDSLRGITLGPNGSMVEIQELKDGVQDSVGQNIQYFSGLTALTVSPDGANVYAVGTTVMPAIGGVHVLQRNALSGLLSVAQQFRIDQRSGVTDIEGMIGTNSVAVSPDGRFVYVTSGGYYRDHNLLVFARDKTSGGTLNLIQNVDIYNQSSSRILPSSVVVSHKGDSVYVIGDNFAISSSAILVYSVDDKTGLLTQIQEVGALRSTLLATASFDPKGNFLYVTASLGNELVWVFKRETDGQLTVVVDSVAGNSARDMATPQGSYAASITAITPVGDMLFVAVEKDNKVYMARRNVADGRLAYYEQTVGGAEDKVGRPTALAFNTAANILYVSGQVDNVVASYKIGA